MFWPHRSFVCFSILNSSYMVLTRKLGSHSIHRRTETVKPIYLYIYLYIEYSINVKEKYMRRTYNQVFGPIYWYTYIGVPRQRHELSSRYRTRRYTVLNMCSFHSLRNISSSSCVYTTVVF